MMQTYVFNYDKTRMADISDFGDGSYHDDLTAHDGMTCQADMTTSANGMVDAVFEDTSELQVYCDELDGSENMVFASADGKVVFDDYAEYVDDSSDEREVCYWAEICKECLAKYRKVLGNGRIDEGSAQGICSVKGCENEADSYVDFGSSEVFFLGRMK